MIYPPGYDATKPYQEIEYNGHSIVVFNDGLEAPLIARLGEDVYRVLRSTEPMSDTEWFRTLQATEKHRAIVAEHARRKALPRWRRVLHKLWLRLR